MSKIDKFIKEHCPNGVRFRTLSELCLPNPKSKVGAKKASAMATGKFPFFTSGKNIYCVNDYMIEGENIFVNDGGVADIRYYDGKASYADHVLSLKNLDGSRTDLKFIYYYLDAKKDYINDFLFRGSGLKNLQRKEFMNFKIPVPPLKVQQEIIRMLDSFTELEAELEAELTKRKQQYHYYSNSVLRFESAPRISLEDLCDIVDYRGKTPKKSKDGIFLVTAKNIRKGYIDYDKSKEYISENIYEDVMHRGKPMVGDVLITTEAPCGYVAQVDKEDIALAQRVIKYRPKDSRLNSSFLKYILLAEEFQNKLQRAATGGTVKGIKGSKLHKLTIPVPDINIQEETVEILNRFNELCYSITDGLPAEIEARHKQYEYYRDKLLTFEGIKR